jgi:hypothetical protein
MNKFVIILFFILCNNILAAQNIQLNEVKKAKVLFDERAITEAEFNAIKSKLLQIKPSKKSSFEELSKVKKLLDEGVIPQVEYEAIKERLLNIDLKQPITNQKQLKWSLIGNLRAGSYNIKLCDIDQKSPSAIYYNVGLGARYNIWKLLHFQFDLGYYWGNNFNFKADKGDEQ